MSHRAGRRTLRQAERRQREAQEASRQFLRALAAGQASAVDRFGEPIEVGCKLLYKASFDIVFQVVGVSPVLDRNLPVVCLDGDEMRATLCSDLGFKSEARLENHRRIAEIARLLNNQDLNVVVATMAPEHLHRDTVAKILGRHLVWFYIHAPLDVCIERDPKGLYKRALAGQIQQLTNYPFEPPRPAEQENYINTVTQDIAGCHQSMLETVRNHLKDFTI